jgi:hypothetical protein
MIILCLGYKSIYIFHVYWVCRWANTLGYTCLSYLSIETSYSQNPNYCQAAQGAKAGVESNNIKDKINFKSFVYNAIKLSLSLMVLANKDIRQINRYLSSIIKLMIIFVAT